MAAPRLSLGVCAIGARAIPISIGVLGPRRPSIGVIPLHRRVVAKVVYRIVISAIV